MENENQETIRAARQAHPDDPNIIESGDDADTATSLAYIAGLNDGLESPDDLSMGLTWEPDPYGCNEAYDRGVNRGQELAQKGNA